ncbi:MAG: Zn-dependent protease with chaperone function [Gammaproteobacteria bacterium]
MIQLGGLWYPVGSSAQADAKLDLTESRYQLKTSNALTLDGLVSTLEFSQRVGNIPRHISFNDGSQFVTKDNDLIDQWLLSNEHNDGRYHFLYRVESQWRWILVSLLVVIIASGGFFWKGLPWLSNTAAAALPVTVYQKLGDGTLDILDKSFLSPSELKQQEQDTVRQQFNALVKLVGEKEYRFELHFRKMGNLPNAFALPSGDIVVTDQLIHMSSDPEELNAVFVHEMGHVIERHSVQQIIHASAISVMATVILGDVSAISNLAIALPGFIIESSYSRDHETEADDFALTTMIRLNKDPVHFANIMQKFLAFENAGKVEVDSEATVGQYFSTHPATGQRIERARELSEGFNQ